MGRWQKDGALHRLGWKPPGAEASNDITAAINLVWGAASNTSDAPRCSSVSYLAATGLIKTNNAMSALIK
jgi:hypothetical protein